MPPKTSTAARLLNAHSENSALPRNARGATAVTGMRSRRVTVTVTGTLHITTGKGSRRGAGTTSIERRSTAGTWQTCAVAVGTPRRDVAIKARRTRRGEPVRMPRTTWHCLPT